MRLALLVLLALASCSNPECRYGLDDARLMMQDPAGLHDYFLDQIRCGQYGVAYERCLSAATKRSLGPYEAGPFYFLMQYEIVRRMILGFEQEEVRVDPDGLGATARWRNREFGVARDYRLVGTPIGRKVFWGIDFTREQIEELKDAAFAWFRRQKEVADNRLYTYPPDWRYAAVER